MPVTYTNRKGVIYYLCQGRSKTGKPRYYFARELKGEPLEAIPQGWKIQESPNGIVSLVRDRPAQIRPEEVAVVDAALQRHPKAGNYRLAVKGKQIEVYERVGPDVDELAAALGKHGMGTLVAARMDALREVMDEDARFTPVLRLILADPGRRIFRVQRMCYLGSVDDWIEVDLQGALDRLARKVIPTLGTDDFFELW
jgi:hypothetical protein